MAPLPINTEDKRSGMFTFAIFFHFKYMLRVSFLSTIYTPACRPGLVLQLVADTTIYREISAGCHCRES